MPIAKQMRLIRQEVVSENVWNLNIGDDLKRLNLHINVLLLESREHNEVEMLRESLHEIHDSVSEDV